MKQFIETCLKKVKNISRFIFKWSHTLFQAFLGLVMSFNNIVSMMLNAVIITFGALVSYIDFLDDNRLQRQRMVLSRSYTIFGKKFKSGSIFFRLLQVIAGLLDVAQDVFCLALFTCLSLPTAPIKFICHILSFMFKSIKSLLQSFIETCSNVYTIHYKYFARLYEIEITDYNFIYFNVWAVLIDIKANKFSKKSSQFRAFSVWVENHLTTLQSWIKPWCDFYSGICFNRLQQLRTQLANDNDSFLVKFLGCLFVYFFLIPLSILFIDPKMYPNTYGESLPELVAPIFYTFYITLIVMGCLRFVFEFGFKLFEGLRNMVFDLFTTKRFGSIAAGYGYVSSEHFNKTEVPGKFSPSAGGSNKYSEMNKVKK